MRQPFWLGVRIRFTRLRKGLWRERCEACGRRMPLNGTGITETIGTLHPHYHVSCYQQAMREMHGKQSACVGGPPETRSRGMNEQKCKRCGGSGEVVKWIVGEGDKRVRCNTCNGTGVAALPDPKEEE